MMSKDNRDILKESKKSNIDSQEQPSQSLPIFKGSSNENLMNIQNTMNENSNTSPNLSHARVISSKAMSLNRGGRTNSKKLSEEEIQRTLSSLASVVGKTNKSPGVLKSGSKPGIKAELSTLDGYQSRENALQQNSLLRQSSSPSYLHTSRTGTSFAEDATTLHSTPSRSMNQNWNTIDHTLTQEPSTPSSMPSQSRGIPLPFPSTFSSQSSSTMPTDIFESQNKARKVRPPASEMKTSYSKSHNPSFEHQKASEVNEAILTGRAEFEGEENLRKQMDQESYCVQDLLYVLMGIDGDIISCSFEETKMVCSLDNIDQFYHVDSSIDRSLAEIIHRMCPAAVYYHIIKQFIQLHIRFSSGTVNNALAAALRDLIKEYLILVSQLETQFSSSTDIHSLTLQKMYYYFMPTLQAMFTTASLVVELNAAAVNETKNNQTVNLVRDELRLLELKKKSQPREKDILSNELKEMQDLAPCRGGQVLNIIANKKSMLSGDPVAKDLLVYILECASVPYMHFLTDWISHGRLSDRYKEFLVEECDIGRMTTDDYNDAFWQQRYSIRHLQIPIFLTSLQNEILLAGKYLNVLQECKKNAMNKTKDSMLNEKMMFGKSDKIDDQNNIRIRLQNKKKDAFGIETKYKEDIAQAYEYSNKALLHQLMEVENLMGHLKVLKAYFLMEQSDYITHFLDLAHSELSKSSLLLSKIKLQSLLDICLRQTFTETSCTNQSSWKDNIVVSISSMALTDQLLKILQVNKIDNVQSIHHLHSIDKGTKYRKKSLTGLDAFSLDYKIKFPMSLVLSRKSLIKYQLLFRLLFYFKHVERLLAVKWLSHHRRGLNLIKTRRQLSNSSQLFDSATHQSTEHITSQDDQNVINDIWTKETQVLAESYQLRSRMLRFVQNFLYYVSFEVIEPNFTRTEQNLNQATRVDDVLTFHTDFLDNCLKESMLTNQTLLLELHHILSICTNFAHHHRLYMRQLKNYDGDFDESDTESILATDNLYNSSMKSGKIFSRSDSPSKDQEYHTPSQSKTFDPASSETDLAFYSFTTSLQDYVKDFETHMRRLIDALNLWANTNNEEHVANLMLRLDYNGYYWHSSTPL